MIPDFIRLPFTPGEEIERSSSTTGGTAWRRARARGKGLVACHGALGNFELLASAHALKGIPVTHDLPGRWAESGSNDLWRALRRATGVEDLLVHEGGRRCRRR